MSLREHPVLYFLKIFERKNETYWNTHNSNLRFDEQYQIGFKNCFEFMAIICFSFYVKKELSSLYERFKINDTFFPVLNVEQHQQWYNTKT